MTAEKAKKSSSNSLDTLGANSKAQPQDPLPFPYSASPGALARPHHAKVLTLFDRIMNEDNDTFKDLFRPDAVRILWFGPDAGKVQRPADAPPFPRPSGPIKYYNRVQYFGDHVFAETHTAVSEESDPRVPAERKGVCVDAFVVCTLDDEGFITRFEEFLDPTFLSKGKRPVPPPATPPTEVRVYQGVGDPAQMMTFGKKWFTGVLEHLDLADQFLREGQMTRFFSDEKGVWEGKSLPIGFNRKGMLYVGPPPGSTPDFGIYTNRRWFSGNGWFIEMHTVNVMLNRKHPERRYGNELGILFQMDPKGSGKWQLLEWADQTPPLKRTADVSPEQRERNKHPENFPQYYGGGSGGSKL